MHDRHSSLLIAANQGGGYRKLKGGGPTENFETYPGKSTSFTHLLNKCSIFNLAAKEGLGLLCQLYKHRIRKLVSLAWDTTPLRVLPPGKFNVMYIITATVLEYHNASTVMTSNVGKFKISSE